MSMPVIKLGTITREDAIGDIIESIAMEESGLSHILNRGNTIVAGSGKHCSSYSKPNQ